ALGDFSWPYPTWRPAIQNPAPAVPAFVRNCRRLVRELMDGFLTIGTKTNTPRPPGRYKNQRKRPARTRGPARAVMDSADLDFPALAVVALDVLVGLGQLVAFMLAPS